MTEQNYSQTFFPVNTPPKMTKVYDAIVTQALGLTDQNTPRAKGLISYIDEWTKHDIGLTKAIFEGAQTNKNQKMTQHIMGSEVTFYSLNKKGDQAILYHPNKIQTVQVIQGSLSATFDLRAGEVIPIPPGKVYVLENKGEAPAKAWSVLQQKRT